jgi:hypothetical protein
MFIESVSGDQAIAIVDSSNHDQLLPIQIITALGDEVDKWDRGLGNIVRLVARAPTLIKSDVWGEKGTALIGDPFDPDTFDNEWVNPSGWQLTDVVAKLGGLFYALVSLRDIGIIDGSIESIDDLLLDRNQYVKIRNMGDNTLAVFTDAKKRDAWLARGETMAYNGFSATGSFLGYVLGYHGGKVVARPDILSFVTKTFNPGRSMRDKQRTDPRAGWAAKEAVYQRSEAFPVAREIMLANILKYVGLDIVADAAQAPSTMVATMNWADLTFFLNPDAIHYKLDASDVSPAVLAMWRYSIDVERVSAAYANAGIYI